MSRPGFNNTSSSSYTNKPLAAPRDSFELASLASTDDVTADRASFSSSASGITSSRRLSLSSLNDQDPLSANTIHASDADPSRPTRQRTYSISSAFDFATNLFPLSSTAAGGYAPIGATAGTAVNGHGGAGIGGGLERHKTLTFTNGLSLIIGLIIGSGIFSSPSQVNTNAGSMGASLIVWVVAGILAWTGAASYAELGGAIPLNGGAQVYLAKIFGELMGFLFMWCAVFVLKPGSAAIIAIIFGEYVVQAFLNVEATEVNPWYHKGVAVAGLVIVTFINCVSTKMGTRLSDMFMFMKFLALIAVAVIGIVVAATGFSYSGEPNVEWKTTSWFAGTNTDISNLAVALYAGLWAFDGWDNTNYVVGEFKNPKRDLPRVIHTAMPLVIASYLFANIAYFFVLPMAVIESSDTVAVAFGAMVFGPIGSLLLALIVSLSCFGALNATTFTSGRLVYAAGQEGFLPSFLGKLGMGSHTDTDPLRTPTLPSTRPRQGSRGNESFFTRHLTTLLADKETPLFYTPTNAMLFNSFLTLCYILPGEFNTLVTFYGVAGYTFYFLTVLGLIVLRIREPNLERPYKTWLVTPIVFCCVSLWLVARTVVVEPLGTLVVGGFVAAGVPVYAWRVGWWCGSGKGRKGASTRNAGEGGMREMEMSEGGRSWGDSQRGSGWRFWRSG